MLKELIKMAGEFDRLGLTKEADFVDGMITKLATHGDYDDSELSGIDLLRNNYPDLTEEELAELQKLNLELFLVREKAMAAQNKCREESRFEGNEEFALWKDVDVARNKYWKFLADHKIDPDSLRESRDYGDFA